MINIPFAGYKDFNACVIDQMKRHKNEKGFKIENARKICGAIQSKVEKRNMQETFAGGVLNE